MSTRKTGDEVVDATAKTPDRVVTATRVKVRPRVVIWRHRRSWVGGETLYLTPADADMLVRRRTVERI